MNDLESLLEYPLRPRRKYPLYVNAYIVVYLIRYYSALFLLPKHYKNIIETYNQLGWTGILEERDKIKEVARTWR